MPDDLDEFALLWREEPSPEESRALRQLAERTARRARLLDHVEIATSAVLVIGTLVALLIARGPVTIVTALILLLVLLWSTRKRHLLRQVAIIISSGDGGSLVEKEIVKTTADLRRMKIGLFLFPPALLLGHLLVSSLLREGSVTEHFEKLVTQVTEGRAELVLLLVLCSVLIGYQLRAIFRLQTELRRLNLIRAQYQEETRLEDLEA